MSVHDEGYGDNARPTLEFESDFARFRSVGAEGDQSWGAPAHTAHRSEEPFMTSGAGRPGQPGQRSIFGTGRGPVFAQMPAYKPVTRGPEPQPQHLPEPPQPDYGTYEPQSPQMPGVSGYANQNGAAPSYQTPSAPPRNYTTPDFPNPFPPQNYPREPQPQSSQPQPQARPQAHPSQTYPGQSYQPQAPVQPSRQAPMPSA